MGRQNGHGPQAPAQPCRIPAIERGLLREGQAAGGLGSLGFDDQVLHRLERMQVRHGDSWVSMPVAELVAELHREALDVGGWSVLLAQHPELDRLGDDQKLKVRMHVLQVIAAGARVEFEIRQLAHVLDE
jgi:hypothetical protein